MVLLKEIKPPSGGVAPLKSKLELGTGVPLRETEMEFTSEPIKPAKFEFVEAGKGRLYGGEDGTVKLPMLD